MSVFEMRKPQKSSIKSTQSFLKFQEVKDDCMVMKDGTLRAIVGVSSTNFDLKNEEEQNALIFNFQRFLNSLDHSVQILMQSRRMNIGEYTEKLKHLMERQTNELLRLQTAEYIDFITRLVSGANVMNKNFYVIIPISQVVLPTPPSLLSKFFGGGAKEQAQEELANFGKVSHSLEQRVTSVVAGLGSIGLRALRLNSNQIIELLYNSYNFESGPLLDASKLSNIKIIENKDE